MSVEHNPACMMFPGNNDMRHYAGPVQCTCGLIQYHQCPLVRIEGTNQIYIPRPEPVDVAQLRDQAVGLHAEIVTLRAELQTTQQQRDEFSALLSTNQALRRDISVRAEKAEARVEELTALLRERPTHRTSTRMASDWFERVAQALAPAGADKGVK